MKKIVILFILIFTSCENDYLDVVPDNIATIDLAFNTRSTAENFLSTCYTYIPEHAHVEQNFSMLAGDEVWYYAENDFYMNNETSFRVAKGMQNSSSPYLNYWEGGRGAPHSLFVALRDCNIFLENLVAVPGLEEEERLRWLDEVKVLKAFYHFWLMQMYGPIPIVRTNILTPNEYVGSVITLCNNNRGVQKNMEYFGNQVSIVFELPLGGVIIDFFDQIKSITKGFASVEHSLIGFVKSDLTKIDVLINNNKVDALSMIVHKSFSNRKAREIAKNLQKLIPRQMFDVPIQVTLGSKIISRETVKAYRKNVTAKLYGGDVTRKKKLLEKQKEGKKKMKQLGSVSIPQEAFLNYFNSGD